MEILTLLTPSVNRVYGQAAATLAQAEFRFIAERSAPGALLDVAETHEAGVTYLRLGIADDAWEDERGTALRAMLAYSPHVFAAYEVAGRMPVMPAPSEPRQPSDPESERVYVDELDTVPLLQPTPLSAVEHYPSDLLTTLKYQGKTNEQFTALMLHLAAHAAGRAQRLHDGTLRVLDPVAGRGTTLNQALMWGVSATGIDLDKKDAELYRAFLTTWAKGHRLRHSTKHSKLTVNSKALGQQFHAEIRPESGQRSHTLSLYTADTTKMGRVLKDRSFDVLVADLPYGVQHGAKSAGELKRSPLELLENALPTWTKLLVGGGALALAINRNTAPYTAVQQLLDEHGITVVSADGDFRHRVDRAIDRDIVLAVTH